jgi:hypothetical protein
VTFMASKCARQPSVPTGLAAHAGPAEGQIVLDWSPKRRARLARLRPVQGRRGAQAALLLLLADRPELREW